MKKSENKVEVVTVVNGVVLTPEAIDQLKVMQEANNSYIKDERRILADVVCFIASHLDEISDSEKEKGIALIKDLSQTRDWMEIIQKP
jgi:hypothetical protein